MMSADWWRVALLTVSVALLFVSALLLVLAAPTLVLWAGVALVAGVVGIGFASRR